MTKSNSKTPLVFRIGLALLCAMILSTHLMGNLYARYSTTAVGSDRARVAKFAGGTVTLDSDALNNQMISGNQIIIWSGNNDAYHALIATFTLTFDACEVTREYSFSASCKDTATKCTFVCPSASNFFKLDGENYTAVDISKIDSSLTEVEQEKVYYRIGSSGSWTSGKLSDNKLTISDPSFTISAEKEAQQTIQILFFVNAAHSATTDFSDTLSFDYALNCSQVD